METIKIMGKDYATVNARLKEFRAEHKDWSLISDLLQVTNENCVVKATILDEHGRIIATGLAQEDRTSSQINKTSYVENCETSAWGRALGNLGYGIDTAVASADEVAMAVAKQELNREVIGGEYIWEKGKHTGKPISQTPADYLDWYMENGLDNYIKANITKYRETKVVNVANTGNSYKGE